MGQTAFIFAGRNGLDQIALRNNVLRIPEVSLRVREAQEILDALELPRIDLHTYISSDDETFLRNIKMKSLAAAIVQLGLYDRAVKQQQRRPEILVGTTNGDSVLSVVAGRMTFKDLVEQSQALPTLKPVERLTLAPAAESAPLLAGISLTEYEAVSQDETGTYKTIQSGFMDFRKLLVKLVEEAGIQTFVNIGPGQVISARDLAMVGSGSGDVEVLDSIELDPMLGWFWRAARPESQTVAN